MPEDDKYDALEKIGHGSFGVIRKVKRKSDGYILCRKEISYHKMSQKEREQLQSELAILKDLRHPNIVKYYERDHLKASQDLHLYMEFCGNGDLGKVIREMKAKKELAQEDFIWSIFSQIVSALYRCHYGEDPPPSGSNVLGMGPNAKPGSGKPMILHRDLKPENIFLGENNCVKLGDFGLSKIIQSHDFASTYVGTPFYMSPEICKAEAYTLYSDIWALGCIIYEMCSQDPPFNAKTHFELIQKIKLGKYPPIPKVYSPELSNVIASCLQVVPQHRPTTAQLLNLPVVKMMRKEQEVVQLGLDVKEEKAKLIYMQQECERKSADLEKKCQALDSTLRREWEVKARLEIDRQVKHLASVEITRLQSVFEAEVNARVEKALSQHPNRLSTSPHLAPRSNTPIMPAAQEILFPVDDMPVNAGSTSTLGTDSNFASGTDISSLSLDDPPEEAPKEAVVPKRTGRRGPLARAQTMFPTQVPPSPMDVHMADPSPAPAAHAPSLAGLGLSPRRNAPKNIFAAAKEGAKRWEAEVPPTPTRDEWSGDYFDDDEATVAPSPTRPRSTSNNGSKGEASKLHTIPIPKPTQRLASAPNLAKARPTNTVPIIAPSPSRQKSKPLADPSSPSRRVPLKPVSFSRSNDTTNTANSAPRSKKGALNTKPPTSKLQPKRNVQGRTLVELQQARGIPVDGKGLLRSPFKAKSPAVWDPEIESDMPSPFIVRRKVAA
ncbi:G2-specific protein kinase-like protein nimA [Sporormia fimetaria CBS 119925]|uniref:non-specific serine/threonine protein kinase n=1 Tax=Sporormia fimetaria CBS 119925 TaxID=1340428 RepID=A0A6A6VIU7_9PLEO|nr:G2-specific protein kinase-like protein nimA [Sporormia fimetaria CBS 119925]